MKRKIVLLVSGLISVSAAFAATPLWLRDVNISPDGKEIVFCYKGDIYKVSSDGGAAVQLTSQDSYEANPIWSPDGEQIAFASNRKGNFDVYVMPAEGGVAKRITCNSAAEYPTTYTPDGKYVLFTAAIQDPASSALFPTSAMTELYRVSVDGGRPKQVLGTPAEYVNFKKDGSCFLYQDRKGFEDEWRKHHTSSVTRDIWLYDVKENRHTNLTDRAGEDRNPIFSPDGKNVYFLSEQGGSFNVFSFPLDNPEKITAVTNFKEHPVRFLSSDKNGVLCFTYDGEIYIKKQNGNPQKVSVDIIRDTADENVVLSYRSGASSAVVSPDGKQIAFTVRGEVFVSSVEYGTTKAVTHTAANECDVTFLPRRKAFRLRSRPRKPQDAPHRLRRGGLPDTDRRHVRPLRSTR